jgi:molecular chaperone GrpE
MTNPPADDRAARGWGDPAPEGAASENGESTADELSALRAELDQTYAQYQRALADYQNLQRRSQQDRLEHARSTLTSLLRSFLPVADDLARALDSVPAELADHQWVEGIRLVRQKFQNVLEGTGVNEIAALGERFDPQVHEAVGYAPGDDGTVVELVQAGYAIGDRVIRPAMVLVGSGQSTGTAPSEATE